MCKHIKITNSREQLEVLRASGSMPFVSKIVEVNGSKYLDGAISDSIPLQKALDEGYGKIIVVLTRPENYSKKREYLPYNWVYRKYPNFIECGNKQSEMYNSTLELVKRCEEQGRIVVLRPSQNLKIARVEKNLDKLNAIYNLGVSDCNKKLDEIKKYLNN